MYCNTMATSDMMACLCITVIPHTRDILFYYLCYFFPKKYTALVFMQSAYLAYDKCRECKIRNSIIRN